MLVFWISFVIAVLFAASLLLMRKWAVEEVGKDIEEDGLNRQDVGQIPEKKQLTLAAMAAPAGLFLFFLLLYIVVQIIVLA